MPVTFDVEDGVLALRMVGLYEPSDIRATLLAALDDPRGASARGLLFDVRASESLSGRSISEVRAMGRFLSKHVRRIGGHVALLADADFAYGLMRLGSVVLEEEGSTVSVFRDETSARAWLLAPGGAGEGVDERSRE